jgi:hypothetical protein
VAQAGASFSGGTLARESCVRPGTWASSTTRDAPDSTRRATAGRLHKVYEVNTQRKGFKTSGKGGRIRTLSFKFARSPSPFWIARVLGSFSSPAGASFSGGVCGANPASDPSRWPGHQQKRPRIDAPSHRRSIPPGLRSQHAEERLRNQRQRGQNPHLDPQFARSPSPFGKATVLDSLSSPAGASFSWRTLGCDLGRHTRVARHRVAGKTTRRATGGRLHQV